jgi:hypothetical protein
VGWRAVGGRGFSLKHAGVVFHGQLHFIFFNLRCEVALFYREVVQGSTPPPELARPAPQRPAYQSHSKQKEKATVGSVKLLVFFCTACLLLSHVVKGK